MHINDYFPVKIVLPFHGHIYTNSSKPVTEGDLVLYVVPPTEEEYVRQLVTGEMEQPDMYLSLCKAIEGENLILVCEGLHSIVKRDHCVRLTFTIPTIPATNPTPEQAAPFN